MGALEQAIDLASAPTPAFVAALRRRPLPRDVLTLVRVAAGDDGALAAAAAATGRAPSFLAGAAEFYLRQAMCYPGADPFRMLGVAPGASRAEMRANLGELALWLHPDRGGDAADAALMRRVLDAWRLANDGEGAAAGGAPLRRRSRRAQGYKPAWISRPLSKPEPAAAGAARRLMGVLRLVIIIAGALTPALGVVVPPGFPGDALRFEGLGAGAVSFDAAPLVGS